MEVRTGDDTVYVRTTRGSLDIDPTAVAAEIVRVLADHAREDAGLVPANCTKHLRADPNDVAALMRRGLPVAVSEGTFEPDALLHGIVVG